MQSIVKGLGLAVLFGACVLAGTSLEQRLKAQWRLIQEWKEVLQYLEKELTWRRTPLQEALQAAAADSGSVLKKVLRAAAERIQKRDGRAFELIWQEALEEGLSEELLSREKRCLLEEAASALCAQDIVMQRTLLEKCIWHLERAAGAAEEEYLEKGKLYRSLSVMAGIFVVILLL